MKIIGHRGAAGYAPENTLASFRKALELGVDMIEFDVFALDTGELVVLHDYSVDRTTNGQGYVWEFTLGELRGLDAGQGEKIPLLSEALDCINRKVPINIEIKGSNTAEPLARMLKHYIADKGWRTDDFMVSSDRLQELVRFMDLMPEVRACALYDYEETPQYKAFVRRPSAYGVNPDAAVLTEEMVRELHDNGLKVFAWNVKTPEQAERMLRIGADGIFSDFPDTIGQRQRELLASHS